MKSWSSTLRLPKSTFPARTAPADLPKYLKRCSDDFYHWQRNDRWKEAYVADRYKTKLGKDLPEENDFVLHDGPPYANGGLHIGHALNKILKDMICRVEVQRGKRLTYTPGWDCHGLPIEIKALEQQRLRNKEKDGQVGEGQAGDESKVPLDPVEVRRAARNLATKTVKDQMKTFREWGIMADWEGAWKTMDKGFVMSQLSVFQQMVRQGLVFRRYKPVYWSPSSRTALAEAELEYRDDHESLAAYVKFPIAKISEALKGKGVEVGRLSAVVWTTTPWTLPANSAIAVNEDLEYCIVEHNQDQLIIAKSRLSYISDMCFPDSKPNLIVDSILGAELVGAAYTNELRGKSADEQPVIKADFVSAESGSGLVHLAPGHGMDDYEVCTKQGIAAFAPVDDSGCFTSAALPDQPELLTGKSVLRDGSRTVLDILGEKVLTTHKYKHKYPYDWRTKLPIIVRATEQWFADVGSIKESALRCLEDVRFVPESGRPRLESFVKGRSEWCISRQRAWGVPIPALYGESGKAVLTDESVAHIIAAIAARGRDAWWTDAPDDSAWIHPSLKGKYTRGRDTMDVWFDSGTSWTMTPEQADVYIEGTDQHRGWFQSSLLTHTAVSDPESAIAPFKTLITHGFTLDQNGKKMSKSIGNVIAPSQIMDGSLLPPVKRKGKAAGPPAFDGLGPDALRLWVASSDYTKDVVIGEPTLKAVQTMLIKYRTTIKMLLGSIREDSRNFEKYPVTKLDRMALQDAIKVRAEVMKAYKNYEFHKAVVHINNWINNDLSAFYLEAIKDRLYCGDGGGVLSLLLEDLLEMLAPITPVLVDEAWEHHPHGYRAGFEGDLWHPAHAFAPEKSLKKVMEDPTDQAQVLLAALDRTGHASGVCPDVESPGDAEIIRKVHAAIRSAQEEARAKKLMGSSLQSSVLVIVPEELRERLQCWKDELDTIFVVSDVDVVAEDEELPAMKENSWQFEAEFDFDAGEEGKRKGKVVVRPPKDHKCPRCWRYKAEKEEMLCGRCEEVVANIAEEGVADAS